VAILERHGFTAIGLAPQGGERLADVVPEGRMALLLGPEGPGLPPALLQRTRSVRIPMAGTIDSLNVATASGIALAHLSPAR
jgi:tRNA G18 (ribose-2'-O)-methylase SpoU